MSQEILPYLLGQNAEKHFLTNQEVTLGRAPNNHIVLDNNKCSRYHASIIFLAGEFILHDLNSSNGITVNRARVKTQHVLQNGDRIKLGDLEFVFKDPSPTEIPQLDNRAIPPSLDLDEKQLSVVIKRNGRTVSVKMTIDMWKLIKLLYSNPNKICTYEEIIEEVYGAESNLADRKPSLEKLIYGLRKKLSLEKREEPPYIRTVREVGYVLELESSPKTSPTGR